MKQAAAEHSTPHSFDAHLVLALDQVRHLREEYPENFPQGWSQDNRYPPRDLYGYPLGANVGWTSGFWTGMLWLAYELTNDTACRDTAVKHVASFAARVRDRIHVDHHDMGFLYIPSCVAAWNLTGDIQARDAAIAAADCLMGRYLPKAGILQAWGDLNDPEQHGRIIIDCLLNVPLLFWASTVTGKTSYRDAARSHIQKSRDHLVRPDASSFHTYYFDPGTGAPIRGATHQGASDDSCWARGQAWGIYGFAVNHRFAPDLGLLDVARRQAEYFLAHLPANGVAYWDLSFGDGSNEPWDSSSNAIAACGLFELASHVTDPAEAAHYRQEARRLLAAVAEHCAGAGTGSNALLIHGVYVKSVGKGVDEASLWGDYYYLEALARATRNWKGHW